MVSMSSKAFSIADLPWLPRLSADFRTRLQSIELDESDWGPMLRSLATQFLGLDQAIAISRSLNRLRARDPSPSLSPFRLGLVGNATTDFLKPSLEAAALRQGISLEISLANFGQIMQEAMDPGSRINQAKPDAILLAIDHRGLPFRSDDNSRWPPYDHQRRIVPAPCGVRGLPETQRSDVPGPNASRAARTSIRQPRLGHVGDPAGVRRTIQLATHTGSHCAWGRSDRHGMACAVRRAGELVRRSFLVPGTPAVFTTRSSRVRGFRVEGSRRDAGKVAQVPRARSRQYNLGRRDRRRWARWNRARPGRSPR